MHTHYFEGDFGFAQTDRIPCAHDSVSLNNNNSNGIVWHHHKFIETLWRVRLAKWILHSMEPLLTDLINNPQTLFSALVFVVGKSKCPCCCSNYSWFFYSFTLHTHSYARTNTEPTDIWSQIQSTRKKERKETASQRHRWQRMAKIKCKTHAHVRLLLLLLLCFQLSFYSIYLVYTRIRVRNRILAFQRVNRFRGQIVTDCDQADGATSRGAQVSLELARGAQRK